MYYQSQNYYMVPLTAEEMEMLKNMRNKNNFQAPEMRKTDKGYQLYEPREALEKGNIFRNEYRGYKDYKPQLKNPSDERSMLLLDITIYSDAAHDISLKLDIFPTDKELIAKFDEYSTMANEKIKEFQKKYGPLSPSGAGDSKEEFTWVNIPSDWIK